MLLLLKHFFFFLAGLFDGRPADYLFMMLFNGIILIVSLLRNDMEEKQQRRKYKFLRIEYRKLS